MQDTADESCRSFFAKEPLIIGLFCGKTLQCLTLGGFIYELMQDTADDRRSDERAMVGLRSVESIEL